MASDSAAPGVVVSTRRAGSGGHGEGPVRAVVLDLDGTAKMGDGPFSPVLADRLSKLRARGIKVILATGRCVSELETIIDFALFDAVVAENGTVQVIGREEKILAPAEWFPLRSALVQVFGQGPEEVVISMSRSLLPDAQLVVKDRARIELNKDRVMIMPTGFDKGRGLAATLKEMGISKGVTCIGDGENDLSMFRVSDCRVALENSVDILKKEADHVTSRPDGEGAVEAIDELILR